MDVILKGILSSTHPDSIKRDLLQKIADSGGKDQKNDAILSVFDLTSKWYLEGKTELEQTDGFNVYLSWAKNNPAQYEHFFNKDFLQNLFTRKCRNDAKIPVFIKENFRLLQVSASYRNYCSVVDTKIVNYVREHPSLECLTNLADFLLEFKDCISRGESALPFCTNVIHALSMASAPEIETEIVNFIKCVNVVSSLLAHMWNGADSHMVLNCLKVIFSIISSNCEVEPSIALGSLVPFLPQEMINVVVKNAISDSNIDNNSMITAIQRIIDWLQWPTSRLVDEWVIAFLKGLASVQKYSVLITVTENKVDQIFEKLQYVPVRQPGFNILSHMLLSFQHSPEPFHKILPMVPKIVNLWTTDETCRDLMLQLAELLHVLMYLHAGFPELYDPVLECIKDFPKPSPDRIKFKLLKSKWTAHRDGKVYVPRSYQQKAEMGKTGLFNLGNTCYMNSIMQALYMCDSTSMDIQMFWGKLPGLPKKTKWPVRVQEWDGDTALVYCKADDAYFRISRSVMVPFPGPCDEFREIGIATLKKRKATLKALENDIIWALSEVSKSNFHTEEESDTLKESERDLATPLVNSDTDDKVFSDTDISKDKDQGSNFHTEEESDTLKEGERDLAKPLVNSDTDDKVFSDTDISKDQNQGSNFHTEEESDTLKEGERDLATPLVNSDTDDKVFSDTDISKDQNQGSNFHTEEESDTLKEGERDLATPLVNSDTDDKVFSDTDISKDQNQGSNSHTEEESDTLKEGERDLATPLVNSDTDDKVFSDTDISKDQNQGSNFHTEEESDTLKEGERDLATPLVNSDTDDKVFSDTDISKDQNQGSNLHTEEESDTLKEGEQYLATPLINSDTDDKVFSDTDISKDQNQGSSLHTYEESDTLTESEQYLSTPVVISETEDQAISDTDLPEDSNNRFSSDYDNDDSLDEDYNPSGSESDEELVPIVPPLSIHLKNKDHCKVRVLQSVDSLDTNCLLEENRCSNTNASICSQNVSELDLKKLKENHIVRDINFSKIYIRRHRKQLGKSSQQMRKQTTERIYDNFHCCLYCSRFVLHIATHMKTHRNLEAVDNILKMKKPDFTNIRKLGDDANNQKVIERKEGEFLIARRSSTNYLDVQQYGPCPNCREWLLLNGLRQHLNQCLRGSPEEEIKESIGNCVLKSQVMAGLISSETSKSMREEVIPSMKRDAVRHVAINDQLIVMLGESWLRRNQDNIEKRKYYASQHMRLAAKLLIQLRKMENNGSENSEIALWDFLKPCSFDTIVDASLQICMPEMDDVNDLKSPSNAIKLKYDLKRLVNMKYATLLKTNQGGTEVMDCKSFLELMTLEWSERVTKLARTILQERKYIESKDLPSPDDIEKLTKYLIQSLKTAELTPENFLKISALCQTRLMVYNKRRSGELEVITLQSYAARKKDLSDLDESITEDLTEVEKYLLKSQELITVRGKGGRPVPVIIPPDAKTALEYVASKSIREAANISPRNKYLFANTALKYSRAYDNLKEACFSCKLKSPQRITSVAMRKYTATLSQLMNLDKYQMEWVCRHLGHTKPVHKEAYRQMSGLIEKVYVTKLMMVQDLNLTGKYKGQSLQDINLNDIVFGGDNQEEKNDMTKSFRNGLLQHNPSPEQALVVKLQHVFAFLSHSQRPAYAPVSFLAASRPPWFTPGFQQDCSEFLKYLLDQLHEQETSFIQKNGSPPPRTSTSFRSVSKATSPLRELEKRKARNTLIGDNFGGKMTTTITCLNCDHKSTSSENFMDLPLAFPDYNATSQKSLVGGASKMASSSVRNPSNDAVCQASSSESEERMKCLHLNDLMGHYLKPEKLVGDNKYFCDRCDGLQDAERKIDIVETPEYLILTLLRFSFDIRLQSRSKIFREVKYPKTLVVPTSESKDGKDKERRDSLRSAVADQLNKCCDIGMSSECVDIYSLCSVVIHSGTSSDCGHYYCYARHSVITNSQSMFANIQNCSKEDDIDFLQDKWYLFNDSSVSYASYSSFSNVTKRFTKDTAYVLIYRKIDPENLAGQRTVDTDQSVQPTMVDVPLRGDLRAAVNKDNKTFLQLTFIGYISLGSSEDGRHRSVRKPTMVDVPLRGDLRAAVNKDNKTFLQEQENAAAKNNSRKRALNSTWYNWSDDDDRGGSGPCGGGGGVGGIDSGPRFVF